MGDLEIGSDGRVKNGIALTFRDCAECGNPIGVLWNADPAKIKAPASCAEHN